MRSGRSATRRLDRAEARIRAVLAPLSASQRLTLLRAILLPRDERAELIGTLYRDGDAGALGELLIDLEEDRHLGLLVADVLKETLHVRGGVGDAS